MINLINYKYINSVFVLIFLYTGTFMNNRAIFTKNFQIIKKRTLLPCLVKIKIMFIKQESYKV